MKKSILYLFAVLCSVCVFTSCEDKEENDAITAKEIAGTYNGNMTLTVMEVPQPAFEAAVSINALSETNVIVAMGSMTIMNVTMDNVMIPCTVKADGETMELNGEAAVTVQGMGDVSAQLTGKVKGKQLTLTATVTAGTVEVSADFSGKK